MILSRVDDWLNRVQGGDELNAIINKAMSLFVVSNPLHPDVFPGVRKMESEIVSMCLNLYVSAVLTALLIGGCSTAKLTRMSDSTAPKAPERPPRGELSRS